VLLIPHGNDKDEDGSDTAPEISLCGER
jgi:hypothetical protein